MSDDEPVKTINQSELNRLVQQIHDLREALRPFAVFAGGLPKVVDNQPRLTDWGPAFTTGSFGEDRVLTFADLRHAKALLDGLEAEDVERHIFIAEEAILKVPCHACGLLLPENMLRKVRGMNADGEQFCWMCIPPFPAENNKKP